MNAIHKRDLQGFFRSPLGYVYIGAFLAIMNLYFFAICVLSSSSDMGSVFSNMLIVFLFLMPILTMRLFSEEYKQGTDRLLLTAPVSVWEIVFGKFLAAVSVLLVALACTLPWIVIVAIFGTPAWASILGCYIAVLCAAAVFVAMGMFLSSLTESQLIAAVLSFALFLGLYVADMLSYSLDSSSLPGMLLSWLSIFTRYDSFMSGQFSFGNLIYFLSLTGLFLYLTARVLERRRL
ncbi:MAG: ABC transporter permease [Butyricicoccus porcorum]|nr:ABC transporter permease [Butyricicoccus porcorum]MDY4482698.1 ABC transporter permease [Butyricicoccus porcorum]